MTDTTGMVRLSSFPGTPPVGTRCFYQNEALKLEGWGEIVEPADEIDAEEIPILLPWRGTLVGPESPDQRGLEMLAPGCGTLPGEMRYTIAAAYLLWVPK